MPLSKQPSRDYFDARFQDLARHFNSGLGNLADRVDSGFSGVIKEFTEVNAKLDALMEMVAVRQEVRNLVREPRAKGVEIDSEKVFLA